MQIAHLWREHVQAGCPAELNGLEIAGTDVRTLDAEITACVSAYLTNTLRVDSRIGRRLTRVSFELTRAQGEVEPPVAEYCARLNRLVSAVLTATNAHGS